MAISPYSSYQSVYTESSGLPYRTRRSIVEDAYTKVRALEKKQRKNKKLKLLL